MSVYEMKLPDVGEGVAEAELVEWLVGVGDSVTPDTVIAEVLTDKATVEVSAPVTGEVVELHGEPGDVLAVGGSLIGIRTEDTAADADASTPEYRNESTHESTEPTRHDPDEPTQNGADESTPDDHDEDAVESDDIGPDGIEADAEPASGSAPTKPTDAADPQVAAADRTSGSFGRRATAAPAVRARAADLGIGLDEIEGSGPEGRVVHADLDRALTGNDGSGRARRAHRSGDGHAVPVRGVRRRIAERLSAAWREIPHITYVDDADVSELERLRSELNVRSDEHHDHLTILPFLARAIVVAVSDHPELNAHYDHESETLTTFDAVHVGIATQTDDGLRVPVVRHAEGRDLRDLATEIARVTSAARDGSATRDELAGSTITITSLGPIGGVVTTPIINPPEVAIVGVNRMETRPVWQDGAFRPRQVLNLSSSFDHRMVDGWDAATFVQSIKRVVETPALLFVTDASA